MIAAIIEGDDLLAIGAVGLRKMGSDIPVQATDVVHLGSCTKAMTATLLGMLVDTGKLTWTTTLAESFPDLASGFHQAYRSVTLTQLLTHRAGLPANGPWWNLGRARSTTEQRRELLRRVLKDAPVHPPGTAFLYSNVGYALAGLMAEQVTEQAWETLMTERLFRPLKMPTAGFGPPGTHGMVDQPWGHHEVDGKLIPTQHDNAPALGPAGTVHCSVPDWGRFASLHLRAAQNEPKLLKDATFQKLHTPAPGETYAAGWGVLNRSWAGGTALSHSGSNTYWYATIWIAPRRNFATLVATNQGDAAANQACDAATVALIAEFDARRRPAR